MYNPETILTESGFENYKAHLRNIENGIFYITNHADDLHINEEDLEVLYATQNLLGKKILLTGDGETDD